jgi:hypothetical protein
MGEKWEAVTVDWPSGSARNHMRRSSLTGGHGVDEGGEGLADLVAFAVEIQNHFIVIDPRDDAESTPELLGHPSA